MSSFDSTKRLLPEILAKIVKAARFSAWMVWDDQRKEMSSGSLGYWRNV